MSGSETEVEETTEEWTRTISVMKRKKKVRLYTVFRNFIRYFKQFRLSKYTQFEKKNSEAKIATAKNQNKT